MLVAKFIDEENKRVNYIPVMGWENNTALVPGLEKTEDAGTLFSVDYYMDYGKFQQFLFTSEDVEYDMLKEEDVEIEEYYLYSDSILGEDRDGMLSE